MAAGLDSLGSVELRNTLESSLALPLPPTLVMDYPTAAAIAAYAAAKMPAAAADADDMSEDDISVVDQELYRSDSQWQVAAPRAVTMTGEALPVLAVTAFSTRYVPCAATLALWVVCRLWWLPLVPCRHCGGFPACLMYLSFRTTS